MVLLLDELYNFAINIIVSVRIHVVIRRSRQANDATNIFIGDAKAGAIVEAIPQAIKLCDQVHDQKLHLEWQPCSDVIIVDVVQVELGNGQKVSKTAVVTNKNKVLLILGQELDIFLLVFAIRAKQVIPNGHKQGIVSRKESMMSEMEFGGVKQVLDGRVLAGKDWISDTHIRVAPRIDNIKCQQVCTNHHPMLTLLQGKGYQKGWTEGSNVDYVFQYILAKRRGGECVDGQVMKAMHHFHPLGDV